MLKKIPLVLFTISITSFASEDVLTVDRYVKGEIEFAFPNELNVQPALSEFKVEHFVLMSNESGERWAVVTLTNQASGSRNLTNKQLMAQVADGSRISSTEFSQSFKANETLSVTIDFGYSEFPLLSVYSRPRN